MKAYIGTGIILIGMSFFNWTFGERNIESKEPTWLKKNIKQKVIGLQEPYFTQYPQCYGVRVICNYQEK